MEIIYDLIQYKYGVFYGIEVDLDKSVNLLNVSVAWFWRMTQNLISFLHLHDEIHL